MYAAGKNIIGLRGIGGVGKTALALKLAESLKDRYPDGQIMVDMMGTTNPILPMEAMAFVIRSYHRNEKVPESEDEVRGRYIEVLSSKRVLILLDNALDDKQVIKLIPPRSCALLITSRRTIKIPGLIKKDLDVMKPDEAVEFLINVCCPVPHDKSPGEGPAWPEIASLCGFLPLALKAAASYLANSDDVSPKQYAQELKDERTRLETIGEQGVEMSVDASFGLSFQRLKPAVQKTFLDLSVFPADFDAQAEEKICLDDGHRNLSELVRWSLVDYRSQDRDYGRYRMHDLARLFASARQPDESRTIIAQRHSSYYKDLLAASNVLYLQGGAGIQAGLALFDREEANINAGHTWSCKSSEANSQAAELCMGYPDSGVYVIDLRLNPKQRISWLKEALKAARKLRNRGMEGNAVGNLGLAYADLGNALKAIEYYEQALAILRDIGSRMGEGSALGNLGLAYADLGDVRKAIEYQQHALAITKEIGDKRNEGAWLGNLGLAYAALGDVRKAIEYHEQALAILREIGDRMGEGATLGNLGNAYAALGDARKAIEYHEQARDILHEIGNRRGEGATLGNLGRAYAALGDARKAIEYYEQALAIVREIGDRRGEGNVLFNSSLALYELGKNSEAIKNAEAALEIYRQIESPVATRVEQQLAEWRK